MAKAIILRKEVRHRSKDYLKEERKKALRGRTYGSRQAKPATTVILDLVAICNPHTRNIAKANS